MEPSGSTVTLVLVVYMLCFLLSLTLFVVFKGEA